MAPLQRRLAVAALTIAVLTPWSLSQAKTAPGAAPPPFTARMLKDVNSLQTLFYPGGFAQSGPKVLFTSDIVDGYVEAVSEWLTDGTSRGTRHFIVPGVVGLVASDPVTMGSTVYFVNADGTKNAGLWRSDGTPGGTKLIKPFSADFSLSRLTVMGSTLYFLVDSDQTGFSLWKTDGTPGGTVSVHKIPEPQFIVNNFAAGAPYAGGGGARIVYKGGGTTGGRAYATDAAQPVQTFSPYTGPELVVMGANLYFAAGSGSTGMELWKSDGTTKGTGLLKDIDQGSESSNPDSFTVIGNELYFTADDGVVGRQLWKTNGTAKATVMVKDIPHGNPRNLASAGDRLLFVADRACLTISGICHSKLLGPGLWLTDGSSAGTRELKQLQRVQTLDFGNVTYLGRTRGKPVTLFTLSPRTGSASGSGVTATPGSAPNALPRQSVASRLAPNVAANKVQQLWVTNGTVSGTKLIKVIDPQGNSGIAWITKLNLTPGRSEAVFSATDGTHGRELWRSDGTTSGTDLVKDINPGSGPSLPRNFAAVQLGGKPAILFAANDRIHGFQLWRTDGTTSGTTMVRRLNTTTASLNPDQFIRVSNHLDFTGQGPLTSSSLFSSTNVYRTLGTARTTGLIGAVPQNGSAGFLSLGNRAITVCKSGQHTFQLCALTESGIVRIATLKYPRHEAGDYVQLIRAGAHAYVNTGKNIWITDGTRAGTRFLSQSSSDITHMVPVGGRVFFWTQNSPRKLWIAGDSPAVTRPVRMMPGPIRGPFLTSGRLTFVVYVRHGVAQLWQSNGTATGTVRIVHPTLNEAHTTVEEMHQLAHGMYLIAHEASQGTVLWLTDGTGTHRLLAFRGVHDVTVAGGRAYFIAADGWHGYELWSTDGTSHGTHLVKDIRPGLGGSSASDFTLFNSGLLFTAQNRESGRQLWWTDGTAAGTRMVTGRAPAPSLSDPGHIVVFDGRAFFLAGTPKQALGLFETDGTAAGTALVRGFAGFGGSAPTPVVFGSHLFFSAYDNNHGTELWVVSKP